MGYTSGAMPWKTITPMDEITRFVLLAQTDRFTITDLCEQFGISRKTEHKHLERFAAAGMKGLQPRSHRPHAFPQRTDEAVEALVPSLQHHPEPAVAEFGADLITRECGLDPGPVEQRHVRRPRIRSLLESGQP